MRLPRARSRHVLGPPFQFGTRRARRLDLHDEPELHLGAHVAVPDLAGWRREQSADAARDGVDRHRAGLDLRGALALDANATIAATSASSTPRRALGTLARRSRAPHARGVRAEGRQVAAARCVPRQCATWRRRRSRSELPAWACCGRSIHLPKRRAEQWVRLRHLPAPATAARSAARCMRPSRRRSCRCAAASAASARGMGR